MSKPLQRMAERVYEVNRANGWFDDRRSFGDGIALLHSEVSEAFEAYRDHGFADQTAVHTAHTPKPEGVGSEFADILVRLLDESFRQGIDLDFEFDRKLEYNATRGHKHGGKLL